MSKVAAFKQSDVKRALKGAQEAGWAVAEIEINPVGTILLRIAPTAQKATTRNNSLDQKYGA